MFEDAWHYHPEGKSTLDILYDFFLNYFCITSIIYDFPSFEYNDVVAVIRDFLKSDYDDHSKLMQSVEDEDTTNSFTKTP